MTLGQTLYISRTIVRRKLMVIAQMFASLERISLKSTFGGGEGALIEIVHIRSRNEAKVGVTRHRLISETQIQDKLSPNWRSIVSWDIKDDVINAPQSSF